MSSSKEVLGNYNPLDNTLYYITIANETKTVSTTCVGIGCVDNALKDSYKSIDELPSWVRDQIVRINMLKTTDMNMHGTVDCLLYLTYIRAEQSLRAA